MSYNEAELEKILNAAFPELEFCKILGGGSFGSVCLARERDTSAVFAVKIMNDDDYLEMDHKLVLRMLKHELLIHTNLNHINILQVYEIEFYRNFTYMKIEFAPRGDLLDYINGVKDWESESARTHLKLKAKDFIRQIAGAIQYCHLKSICHRDLKPDNILIGYNEKIKIGDFGMATRIKKGQGLIEGLPPGTVLYIPPELYEPGAKHTPKADIFAIGNILFMLTTRLHPFDPKNELSDDYEILLERIRKRQYQIPDHFNSQLKDIIVRSLEPNSKSRLSMKQFLEHAWLSNQ